MAKLDLIMAHYKYPWETCAKFFDMLDLQRGICFMDFRVILIHDGTDPFPDEKFSERPYRVEQHRISHAGISAVRNAGIHMAQSEWIMFCDCDDMFATVYALRDLLSVLPAPQYDMMWAPFIAEDVAGNGETILHIRGQNVVFIHSKLYRRQYLIDSGLTFDETLDFNEDSAFNAILTAMLDHHRIGEIKTPLPPYIWCYNANSATTTKGNRIKCLWGLYRRNKSVVNAFKKLMPYDRYCGMVARACVDAYYMLNLVELPEELKLMREDFVRFFKVHGKAIWDADADTLRKVKAISKAEHEAGDHQEVLHWGDRADVWKLDESKTVTQWLKEIEREGEGA